MPDRIEEIAAELRTRRSFRLLDKHIARILIKKGIISQRSVVECVFFNRDSPECCFACRVGKDNNVFGNDLTIIIKGDHSSEKRCLRVAIQLGDKLCTKKAEDDKPRWSAHKVFSEEIKDIERDIQLFFEGGLKCD
jgi:thermostable 8-oxoguanine DNA glycosylase